MTDTSHEPDPEEFVGDVIGGACECIDGGDWLADLPRQQPGTDGEVFVV